MSNYNRGLVSSIGIWVLVAMIIIPKGEFGIIDYFLFPYILGWITWNALISISNLIRGRI